MESINYQNFRIDAENICVDYNGKVALYDANLRLKPGQICGLVGMNGAGKTTFFNALTGFVNISKGKIRINGESVRSAQKDQTIAYVPQNEGIDSQFPISVWDVVMMGRYGSMNIFRCPRESDVQAVKDAIERVDLTDQLSTPIGNLSGGQKKLLELGRTMMVDAKLVLLDEVGAGVNRTLLKDLGTAIEKLNKEKGYTFCMIEHDMDFIGRLCDPVIVMAEGSVLFEGSVEDAKKDERVIESYLGRGSKLKDN